ncbi:hypothetical protein [Paenibacillus sp. BIHB 4019]|uniref:hypothetical protein n=1 Tax=Paenibacillus sp. BIHB 4019 TaxID=1870819 RepID=UPI0012377166|nr:hypothetical protein [Paenibacillus sp. BIHB 4019]
MFAATAAVNAETAIPEITVPGCLSLGGISVSTVDTLGSKIIGKKITVDVNHFTNYAVLAVDSHPIKVNFSDISGH